MPTPGRQLSLSWAPAAARELAASRDDLAVILLEPGEDGRLILWIEDHFRIATPLLRDLEEHLTIRVF